jgi:predicted transcriptional regulator
MPTSKPRITITLSDEQHATLQTLAHLQSVSMSSIIVDLLDTTLPVLQRLSEVLANASQAPQAVLDGLKASLNSAETHMLGHQESVLNQLDLLVGLSGAAGADAAASGREEKPAAKLGPPTSNRGVRNVPPTSKKRPISPMKNGEKNGRAKK